MLRNFLQLLIMIYLVYLCNLQSWILLGVILNHIGQGMVLTYPYSLLPGLKDPDSPIKIDLESGSWLASSSSMAQIIGLVAGSWMMDYFGRKLAHIFIILPPILGWFLIYFASSFTTLIIGRAMLGIGIASLFIGCMVVGECMSPENRGPFLGAKSCSSCLGTALTHVLSYYFNWRSVALWSMMPLILVVCNNMIWPESPSWLAANGKFKKSEKTFFSLRGRNQRSANEFEALMVAQKEKIANRLKKKKNVMRVVKMMSRKDFVKPTLITFFGFILLEASGKHIFPVYAQDFIGEINGNMKLQSFLFTLTVDAIALLSTFTSCLLSKYFGRRTLLIFSGISCLILLGVISSYLFLVSKGTLSNERPWVSFTLFILYFAVSFVGCGTIPITLFGELFPLEHKGTATVLGGFLSSIILAIFLKTTPIMLSSMKTHGTLAVYGAVIAISIFYLYFTLPETRNRTLQEIEEFFNYGRFLDDNCTEDVDENTVILNPEVKCINAVK